MWNVVGNSEQRVWSHLTLLKSLETNGVFLFLAIMKAIREATANYTQKGPQAIMLEDQILASASKYHHTDHANGPHISGIEEYPQADFQDIIIANKSPASISAAAAQENTEHNKHMKTQTNSKESNILDPKDIILADNNPVSGTMYHHGKDAQVANGSTKEKANHDLVSASAHDSTIKKKQLNTKDNITIDNKNTNAVDNATQSNIDTNHTNTKSNETFDLQNSIPLENITALEIEKLQTNAGPLAHDSESEKANHHKEKKTEKTVQHVSQKNITLPNGHQVVETKTKTVEVKVTETTKVSAEKNKNSPKKHDKHNGDFEAVVDKALKGIKGNSSGESDGFGNEIKSIKSNHQNEPFHLEPVTKSDKMAGLKENIIDSPEVSAALDKGSPQLDKMNTDASVNTKVKPRVTMTSKKAKFNITHGNSKKTETEIDLRGKKLEPKQPKVALILVGNDGQDLALPSTGMAQGMNEVKNMEAPSSGLSSTRDIIANTLRKELESALAAEATAANHMTPESSKTNDFKPATDSGGQNTDIHSNAIGSPGETIIDQATNERYQQDSSRLQDNRKKSVINAGALEGLLGRLMSGERQLSLADVGGGKSDGGVLSPKCINLLILSPDGLLQKIGSPKKEISVSAGKASSSLRKKLDMGVEVSGPTGNRQSLQLGLSSGVAGVRSGLGVSNKDHTGTHTANIDVHGKSGFAGVNLNDDGFRTDAAELGLQTQGVSDPNKFYLLMVGAGPTGKDVASLHGQKSGSIARNNLKATKPIASNTYLASTQESGLINAIGVDIDTSSYKGTASDNIAPYKYRPFEGIEPLTPTYAQTHNNRGIKRGMNHLESKTLIKSKNDWTVGRKQDDHNSPNPNSIGTERTGRVRKAQTNDKTSKAQSEQLDGKNILFVDPILERSVENSINKNDAPEPNSAKVKNHIEDLSSNDSPPADNQETKSTPVDKTLVNDTVHQLNNDGTIETKEKAGLNKTKKAKKTSEQVTKKEIKLAGGNSMVETKAKTVEVKVTETTNVTAEKNTTRSGEKNKATSDNKNPDDIKDKTSSKPTVVDKAIDGIKKELYGGKSAGASNEINSIIPADQNEISKVEANLHRDVKKTLDQNIMGSSAMNSALTNGLSKLAKVTKDDTGKTDIKPGINRTSKKAKFNIAHGKSKKSVTEIDLTAARPEKKQPDVAIIVVGNAGNGPDSSFKGLAQSLDQISQSETVVNPATDIDIIGTVHERDLKKALAAEVSDVVSGLPGSPNTFDLRTATANKGTGLSQTVPNDFKLPTRGLNAGQLPQNQWQAQSGSTVNKGTRVSKTDPDHDGMPTGGLKIGTLQQDQRRPGNSRQTSTRLASNDFLMNSNKRQLKHPQGLRPVKLFATGKDVQLAGTGQTSQTEGRALTHDTYLPPYIVGVTGIPILPEGGYISPDTETSFNSDRGNIRPIAARKGWQAKMARLRGESLNQVPGSLVAEQSGFLTFDSGRAKLHRGRGLREDIRSKPAGVQRAQNLPGYNTQNRFLSGRGASGNENGVTGPDVPDIRFVDLTSGSVDAMRRRGSRRPLQSGGGDTTSSSSEWRNPTHESGSRGSLQDGKFKTNSVRTTGSKWNVNRDAVGRNIRTSVDAIMGGKTHQDTVRPIGFRSDVSQERPVLRPVLRLRAAPTPVKVFRTRNAGGTTMGRGHINEADGHLTMARNKRGGRAHAGSPSGQTRATSNLNGRRSLVARHFRQ